MFSFIISFISLLGMFYVSRKSHKSKLIGWIITLIGGLGWIAYSISTHQAGLVFYSVVLEVIQFRAMLNYK